MTMKCEEVRAQERARKFLADLATASAVGVRTQKGIQCL
jgi:hypothetical protein